MTRPSWTQRLALVAQVVQVRLRFVIVLIVAFLVVGQWGTLRNYADAWAHRWFGTTRLAQPVSDDTEFFCPMDPGVVSEWPAICPVCNMDLVRRKKHDAVILPEGVVARMQFSPYRIQLAGIKTSIVGIQPLSREIVVAGKIRSAIAAESDQTLRAGISEFVIDSPAAQSDAVWLTEGREAAISIESLPGIGPLAGTIVAGNDHEGEGELRSRGLTHIQFADSQGLVRAGFYAVARIRIPANELEPFRSSGKSTLNGVLAVPESAVVDSGGRRVVYVESMPGMFDGVEVTLGPRCGEFFPVVNGLEAGQRVATIGAFLIDAEARLNPNLAAGYFGASRSTGESRTSPAPIEAASSAPKRKTISKKGKSRLSPADLALVKQQKICPVTELPLDSMGGPVAVDVAGKRVFICCQGCETKLKQDPQKYLARIPPQ